MKEAFSIISSIIFALLLGVILVGSYFYAGSTKRFVHSAIAVIHPSSNSKVSGVVTFEETRQGLRINAEIDNLTPGKHGFHIHQLGDCSCKDATCAGGHYNPFHKDHGGLEDSNRHAGDLGNLTADKSGHASLTVTDRMMKLNGVYSIVGRSVIIHADEDDLVSQPTGNSGSRIGCGVIGISQEAV